MLLRGHLREDLRDERVLRRWRGYVGVRYWVRAWDRRVILRLRELGHAAGSVEEYGGEAVVREDEQPILRLTRRPR